MKKITFLVILMTTFITNAQIILSEDFETATISEGFVNGWTVESAEGTVGEWVVNNPTTETPLYGGNTGIVDPAQGNCTNNYAVVDSDGYGSAGSQDTSLISPVFDLSGYTDVILSLNQWHRVYQASVAYIDSSINNGASWENIVTQADAVGNTIIDISSLGGNPEVQIRFRYTGAWEYWWGIDDITIQQPEGSAPDICTNMAPTDQATDVEITLSTTNTKLINFSWDAATTGDAATSYNVSIGATNELEIGTLTGFDGSVDGGGNISFGDAVDNGWQANTTYYWKVTSVNVAGSTDSPIFSFTTAAADPLGIEEASLNAFNVSPNPVKDVVTINTTSGFDTVEVFNQLGQSVLKSSSSLMNNNRLDLSSLNPGIYLMRIRSNNKSKTLKIIKE